jgi:hypothetical protein
MRFGMLNQALALLLAALGHLVALGLSPHKSLILYLDVADALLNPCGQAPGREVA